jgi:hypothetical protein
VVKEGCAPGALPSCRPCRIRPTNNLTLVLQSRASVGDHQALMGHTTCCLAHAQAVQRLLYALRTCTKVLDAVARGSDAHLHFAAWYWYK